MEVWSAQQGDRCTRVGRGRQNRGGGVVAMQ